MSNQLTRRGGAALAGISLSIVLFMSIHFLAQIRAKVDDLRPLLVLDLMSWPIPNEHSLLTPPRKKVSQLKPLEPAAPVLKKSITEKPTVSPKPKELPKQLSKQLSKQQIIENSDEVLEPPPITTLPVVANKPPDESLPTPVPIFRLTLAPRFLHKEIPIYPLLMRTQGNTGLVKLEVLIDEAGKVRQVKVVQSAGSEFDNAAKTAILASSFTPARVENKPVAVILRLPVNFELL